MFVREYKGLSRTDNMFGQTKILKSKEDTELSAVSSLRPNSQQR